MFIHNISYSYLSVIVIFLFCSKHVFTILLVHCSGAILVVTEFLLILVIGIKLSLFQFRMSAFVFLLRTAIPTLLYYSTKMINKCLKYHLWFHELVKTLKQLSFKLQYFYEYRKVVWMPRNGLWYSCCIWGTVAL